MDKIREATLYINGVEFGRINNFEVELEKAPYCEKKVGVKFSEIKSNGSFENIKIVKKNLFKIYSNNREFIKLMTIYNQTKKKRTKKKYYNKMIRSISNQVKQ